MGLVTDIHSRERHSHYAGGGGPAAAAAAVATSTMASETVVCGLLHPIGCRCNHLHTDAEGCLIIADQSITFEMVRAMTARAADAVAVPGECAAKSDHLARSETNELLARACIG
jgi:hypothetical protein